MRNLIMLFFVLIIFGVPARAQVYQMKETNITFFSVTPMENIEAKNKYVEGAVSTATNAVQLKVHNIGFVFEKALMQEHFHENYMETEKFPHASFKGAIVEKVDWTKDSETPVTVKGKLSMHGVTKDVEIKGNVKIAAGKASIDGKFQVKVADYGIKVPTLVVKNIAETIDVSITSKLEPLAKK